MDIWLRNLLLGISLAAPLGPAGVAVIRNGLQHGFLAGFLTGIGVTLADTTYLLVVFFGLSPLLEGAVVRTVFLAVGALVLLYLGIQSIRQAGARIETEPIAAATVRHPLLAGYLVNISNPLAVVWWLGIFGALLGSRSGSGSRVAAMASSTGILVGILTWHSFVASLTYWGKRVLSRKVSHYISAAAGTVLILFGLWFLYSAILVIR